jgi:hypothetical protein
VTESNVLRAEYLRMRDTPNVGRLAPPEAGWENVTSRIYNTGDFAGVEFLGLRELELAIARSWRSYLGLHAVAARTRDPRDIEEARVELEFIRDLEALLPQFVD